MKSSRHKQLAIATVGASTPSRAKPETARAGDPGGWWLRTVTVPMKTFTTAAPPCMASATGLRTQPRWSGAMQPNSLPRTHWVQSTSGGNGNALCVYRGG